MRRHRVGSTRLCHGCERPVPGWMLVCQACATVMRGRAVPACPARRPCRVGRHPMPPLLRHDTEGWIVDDDGMGVRAMRRDGGFMGMLRRGDRAIMLGTRPNRARRPGPPAPGRLRRWLARLREALRW